MSELDLNASRINEIVYMCKNCGQCSLTCPTHFVGIFNPLGVLRDIQREGPEVAIRDQPIFNCLTCNRCMTNCPAYNDGEGMNFALMMHYLRVYAENHKLPPNRKPEDPGRFTFLTSALQTENTSEISEMEIAPYFASNSRIKITTHGAIAYFIGDSPRYSQLYPHLTSDLRDIAVSTVKILNKVGISPVVLTMKPSGHDDFWAGNHTIFTALAEENVRRFKEAGVSTVICTNAEDYRTWKYDYPTVVADFSFTVYHLSDYLIIHDLVKKLPIEEHLTLSITVSDSSRLGRLGGGIYDQLRSILTHIDGISLIELESNREESYDCGVSAYLEQGDATNEMWKQRIAEIMDTGAEYLITTSLKEFMHYTDLRHQNSFLPKNFPLVKDWAVFLSRFLH